MKYHDVTGDLGKLNLDFVEMAQSGEELLKMVREWRERLGDKCGVLDSYLAGVLKAMTDTTNALDSGEKGFDEALSGLRSILRHIKEGKDGELRQHPFYPKVRAYMDAHPITQDALYYETYCTALFPQFLTFSVEEFREKCNADFNTSLEEYNIPQLRKTLLSSGTSITEEGLNYLHNLISRVFVFIAPSSVFMQGMADHIILSLISQDKKSGRYAFNLLIDGTVVL